MADKSGNLFGSEFSFVIPGHRGAMNPESRASGFALARAPE
jgi:hypothetical protein